MPEDIPQGGPAPSDSPETGQGADGDRPITAKEFAALLESNKVLQGQTRRAEQESRDTRAQIQALIERLNAPQNRQQAQDTKDEIEQEVDKLDDSDPALAASKRAFKRLLADRRADREELNSVKRHLQQQQQQQQLTAAERQQMDYTISETTDLTGLSEQEVREQIGHLSPDEAWKQAKVMIKAARTNDAGANRDGPKKQDLSVFRDRRPQGGGGGGGGGAFSRADIAKMSPEEYEKNRPRIHAQYKGR